MLDLDAGVDLEEEEVALVVEEELERARVGVLDRSGGIHHRAPEPAAHLLGHRHGRPLFEQLLVAALDGTFALAEVHDGAVVIAEHLELDVPRVLDVLLEIDVADAERGFSLALGRLHGLRQLSGAPG